MYSPELFEICNGNHVMLVCEDENARLDAASHFINKGLGLNQLCIYASVHAFDNDSVLSASNLKSKISNCESQINSGNLQIIDFKPYYESAGESNLSPFEFLKEKLESILGDNDLDTRQNKIMVFADAACCLTQSKEFDQSIALENWWQHTHDEWVDNNQKITIICPHPADILRRELEVKWDIADAHDILVILSSHLLKNSNSTVRSDTNLRILIAESEPDIMILYSEYLSALGHNVSVITDGNRCLSLFNRRDFDLVILDTHSLGNLTTPEVVKEIVRIEPHQKILLTSTNPPGQILRDIDSLGLNNNQVLQKPFHLYTLFNVISQMSSN